MKQLIYSPQPNATPDEVMQVLRVFTHSSLPPNLKTNKALFSIYEALPPEAKRHFKIKDNELR
jgi:hypothetical protein